MQTEDKSRLYTKLYVSVVSGTGHNKMFSVLKLLLFLAPYSIMVSASCCSSGVPIQTRDVSRLGLYSCAAKILCLYCTQYKQEI